MENSKEATIDKVIAKAKLPDGFVDIETLLKTRYDSVISPGLTHRIAIAPMIVNLG